MLSRKEEVAVFCRWDEGDKNSAQIDAAGYQETDDYHDYSDGVKSGVETLPVGVNQCR